jgi:hypothetical protein
LRQFFKTSKVHHCFDQELGNPQPVKCKCRKFISKEFASELVANGTAEWLTVYPEGVSSYDIVLKGITGKTPRAQTIEKAHIERYMGISGDFDPETMTRLEVYHDIEMENRLKLFRNVGLELLQLKQFSDTHGTVVGAAGQVLSDKIIADADKLKLDSAVDDPFIGEALFMPIGAGDQRTVVGRDVEIGKEKLDIGW